MQPVVHCRSNSGLAEGHFAARLLVLQRDLKWPLFWAFRPAKPGSYICIVKLAKVIALASEKFVRKTPHNDTLA